MTESIRCPDCGRIHLDTDIELFFVRPDAVGLMSRAERDEHCEESDDVCAIWDQNPGGDEGGEPNHRYFVRGLLPFPVIGTERTYHIGAWAEVSRACFDKILDRWEDEDQETEPPFPATLANNFPFQQQSLGLSVTIQLVSPKTRPMFRVTDAGHMLHHEQVHGISVHQAWLYTELSKGK